MTNLIEKNKCKIVELCQKHKVVSFALFGSEALGLSNENSDIDFIVQFSEEIELLDYADNFFSFLTSLEVLFGKKVDLISKKSLKNPILIQEINRTNISLYAA